MARDYKNATSRRPAERRGKFPCGVCLLVGVLLGIAVSLAGVWLVGKGDAGKAKPEPRGTRAAGPAPEAGELAPEKSKDSKPKPTAAPHFDFYSMLPKMEVVIPEKELSGKGGAGANSQRTVPVDKPGTYLLQAGSFRSFDDAERLRAELALLGVEAGIEKVTINNNETWHRVRVGPFSDLGRLNSVRQRLKENNIQAVLLKINA